VLAHSLLIELIELMELGSATGGLSKGPIGLDFGPTIDELAPPLLLGCRLHEAAKRELKRRGRRAQKASKFG